MDEVIFSTPTLDAGIIKVRMKITMTRVLTESCWMGLTTDGAKYTRIRNKKEAISRGWNATEMMLARRSLTYNSFLSRATGIPNCSLYLATVLLAML